MTFHPDNMYFTDFIEFVNLLACHKMLTLYIPKFEFKCLHSTVRELQ
jgi:hypothetical protein